MQYVIYPMTEEAFAVVFGRIRKVAAETSMYIKSVEELTEGERFLGHESYEQANGKKGRGERWEQVTGGEALARELPFIRASYHDPTEIKVRDVLTIIILEAKEVS